MGADRRSPVTPTRWRPGCLPIPTMPCRARLALWSSGFSDRTCRSGHHRGRSGPKLPMRAWRPATAAWLAAPDPNPESQTAIWSASPRHAMQPPQRPHSALNQPTSVHPITLDREPLALLSTRSHRGQQCRDAFSDRCAPATRGSNSDQGDHRGVFPQVNSGVVGLAGLEPAASSLSGIEG